MLLGGLAGWPARVFSRIGFAIAGGGGGGGGAIAAAAAAIVAAAVAATVAGAADAGVGAGCRCSGSVAPSADEPSACLRAVW